MSLPGGVGSPSFGMGKAPCSKPEAGSRVGLHSPACVPCADRDGYFSTVW